MSEPLIIIESSGVLRTPRGTQWQSIGKQRLGTTPAGADVRWWESLAPVAVAVAAVTPGRRAQHKRMRS